MGRSWSIGLTLLQPDDILLPVENEMMEMLFCMQAEMPALPGHFRSIRGL